jgi:streptomycin 6-kinase
LELPIGVTADSTGRLPYIGTALILAGRHGAQLLTRWIAGRSLVNLELHGIDASDAALDGLEALRPHQPDLRVSAAAKLETLRDALTALRARGYQFVTLAEAAAAFSRKLPT